MPVEHRRIREVLDADTVNSSTALKIAQVFVHQIKSYLQVNGYNNPIDPTNFPNGAKQSGWLAVWAMGDFTNFNPAGGFGSTPAPYDTPDSDNFFIGKHPNKNGVIGAGPSFNPANGAYGNPTSLPNNCGLRHYAHQVQFGKGASNQNGGLGGNFMIGGTAEVGIPVNNQENEYTRTLPIKMSYFKGVNKTGINNGYVYGDSDDEIIKNDSGPISVGDAAPTVSLPI
tara:strand:- start:854 stop:1534 length:681 start_codon:yes stop_codon:yes gene_type:complete